MKKAMLVMIAAAIIVQFSACRGCGPAANAEPPRAAAAFLAQQGIDPQSIRIIGPDAFITYEASQALEYDGQLQVVWGTIMGALAEYAPGTVTIVNTAGGQPAVTVKARSEDIKAFSGGKIDFPTFMKKVQISRVE